MADILAGLVLAAGAGTRLRPLSALRPKVLCPVGGRPLLDHALDAASTVAHRVAVNAHHGAAAVREHVGGRAHVSVEPDQARGTAGAVGFAREWIDGDDLLVLNGDSVHDADLAAFVGAWDRDRPAVLLVGGGPLRPDSLLVATLLPGAVASGLLAEPSGLYEVCLAPAAASGALATAGHHGWFADCGTPADYLAANLRGSGGASVIGEGAVVDGVVEESVVWDGARVGATESLRQAIRASGRVTVLVR